MKTDPLFQAMLDDNIITEGYYDVKKPRLLRREYFELGIGVGVVSFIVYWIVVNI